MLYTIPLVRLQEGTKRNVFFSATRISNVINVLAFDIEIVFQRNENCKLFLAILQS